MRVVCAQIRCHSSYLHDEGPMAQSYNPKLYDLVHHESSISQWQSGPEYSRRSWVRFSLGARNLFPKKSKTEANVTNLRLSQAMPQVWIGALACEHSRPVILKLVLVS